MTFLENPDGIRPINLESDCQVVAGEDVCLNRVRCEYNDSPKEEPKIVNDIVPVVANNAGDQLVMIGKAYEAIKDADPTSEPVVINTGRLIPTPLTNMADMLESETH